MVRTSPFHGGNMGSNPVGITTKKALFRRAFLVAKSQQRFERKEFERELAPAGVREEHLCDDLANLVVIAEH